MHSGNCTRRCVLTYCNRMWCVHIWACAMRMPALNVVLLWTNQELGSIGQYLHYFLLFWNFGIPLSSQISLRTQDLVFHTWDSKCLALIAQWVRAFAMNPKVGGSNPPQVETFSVSDTFTRTPVRVSKMNAVARAQLTFQMLTLLKKYTK